MVVTCLIPWACFAPSWLHSLWLRRFPRCCWLYWVWRGEFKWRKENKVFLKSQCFNAWVNKDTSNFLTLLIPSLNDLYIHLIPRFTFKPTCLHCLSYLVKEIKLVDLVFNIFFIIIKNLGYSKALQNLPN